MTQQELNLVVQMIHVHYSWFTMRAKEQYYNLFNTLNKLSIL